MTWKKHLSCTCNSFKSVIWVEVLATTQFFCDIRKTTTWINKYEGIKQKRVEYFPIYLIFFFYVKNVWKWWNGLEKVLNQSESFFFNGRFQNIFSSGSIYKIKSWSHPLHLQNRSNLIFSEKIGYKIFFWSITGVCRLLPEYFFSTKITKLRNKISNEFNGIGIMLRVLNKCRFWLD